MNDISSIPSLILHFVQNYLAIAFLSSSDLGIVLLIAKMFFGSIESLIDFYHSIAIYGKVR
jgi:hypothetical protein